MVKFYRIEGHVIFSDKAISTGIELIPNTTDAAGEKHVPVITIKDDEVIIKVGSVEHPSLPAHYIEFILLETSSGIHTKWLKLGDRPAASFKLGDEKIIAAYEYCNLHGLWKCDC